MKRIAFTIILNGIKHLTHNNFFNNMIENFDEWYVVEGVAKPGGSTSWCKDIDDNFHNNFLSNDGTTEFLNNNTNSKLTIIRTKNKPWASKDEQVNAAISEIKKKYTRCFLWQIDVDEQWSLDQLNEAETLLTQNGGKTGCFVSNYFIGPNQQVFGEWGECIYDTYRRLWSWEGELFKTHEPPQLNGKNGPGLLLPQRFNHYSYYFEEDVIFKERYYSGYSGLLKRWKAIQHNRGTLHISSFLKDNPRWSNSQTFIKYINNAS